MTSEIISAIYSITHKDSGKVYYGRSNNINRRFRKHKYELRKGIHDNKHLQRSFNKYGEDNFIFKIEEEVPIDKLIEVEQQYLDWCKLFPMWSYNLNYDSEDGMVNWTGKSLEKMKETWKEKYKNGYTNPNKGKPLSDEHKKKISLSTGGNKNHFHGKHHSEKTRKKMSLSHMGEKHPKLRNSTIYHFYNEKLNIRENCTKYDLYTKYKLNHSHLSSVISGKRKSTGGWSIII